MIDHVLEDLWGVLGIVLQGREPGAPPHVSAIPDETIPRAPCGERLQPLSVYCSSAAIRPGLQGRATIDRAVYCEAWAASLRVIVNTMLTMGLDCVPGRLPGIHRHHALDDQNSVPARMRQSRLSMPCHGMQWLHAKTQSARGASPGGVCRSDRSLTIPAESVSSPCDHLAPHLVCGSLDRASGLLGVSKGG
jgi:hypothetical protein